MSPAVTRPCSFLSPVGIPLTTRNTAQVLPRGVRGHSSSCKGKQRVTAARRRRASQGAQLLGAQEDLWGVTGTMWTRFCDAQGRWLMGQKLVTLACGGA